jgi:serine/threonine-protein kinase
MENMKRCANCGREVAPSARFCSNCGEAQGDLNPRAGTGLLPANRRLNGDRYLIVRKLAQGGQSAVYLAMDTASGQRCAVKEMSESQLQPEEREKAINDFLREANILMSLKHPGLCHVFGTFIEDHKHFLVMEYVEGHNLEDELIGVGRPLDWQRVAAWGIMLADVLGYLHSQNPPIIYRDLKPANVMLTPSGAIKLIDFGIARQLWAQRQRDTARLGTDGYAPLEQYSARSEPRSDLYALGASLYHLLTGRVPEAAPLRATGRPLTPIRAFNPPVPEALERVIQQALKRDPHERFPNALAMRQALEWACQQQEPISARMRASAGPAVATGGRFSGGPASAAGGRFSGGPTPTPGGHFSGGPAPTPSGHFTGAPTPFAGRMNSDGRIPAQMVPPRLRLWPLRIDIGLLEANQTSAVQVLELSNRGGGQLTGITETNSPCVTVDPPQLDGNTTELHVRVSTGGLAPGEYVCHVAVRTNGGDQIVPVRFMVRPPGGVPSGGGWGYGQP